MKRTTIIYIPGLGSGPLSRLERKVIQWLGRTRPIIFFESQWHQSESYADKYRRLHNFANEQTDANQLIAVGISAGASLAVRLLKDGIATQVHSVSGALKGAENIGQAYQTRAVALYDSVKQSESIIRSGAIDAANVTIYKPLIDGVIRMKNMTLQGAEQVRLPVVGHPLGIIVAVLLYIPRLARNNK